MERISSVATAVDGTQLSLVPSTWENTVRKVQKDEVPAAALSLSHSFATDPLSHYLVTGQHMNGYSAEAVWKLHVALMTTIVASHTLKGVVTTTGPDYDGLAVWYYKNPPPIPSPSCSSS